MALDFDGTLIQGARPYQEDTFAIVPLASDQDDGENFANALLLLADGMGGEGGGGIASKLVLDAFNDHFSTSKGRVPVRLEAAVNAANDALGEHKKADLDMPSRAGTTFIGAAITDAGLEWVSVGDSLLLLYRDNKLKRLNADHSGAAILRMEFEAGRLTREQFETNPLRHRLLSAIVGDEIADIDVSEAPIPLTPNDLIILASDGIETLSDTDLAALFRNTHGLTCREINDTVMNEVAARRRTNQDNATIVSLRPDRTMGKSSQKVGLIDKLNEPIDDYDWKRLAVIVVIVFVIGAALGRFL